MPGDVCQTPDKCNPIGIGQTASGCPDQDLLVGQHEGDPVHVVRENREFSPDELPRHIIEIPECCFLPGSDGEKLFG